jgi:haloalkane dehalogenase
MPEHPPSASDPHPRKHIAVADSDIAYVDVGEGHPIVFLHGNPTSSYLWRNVIPHLADMGRCLAPDLIGMGQSGKSGTGTYRFEDHRRYLDAWFEAMNLGERVTLVLHDWGSALGFHWYQRNPARVRAIAYMEAIVKPVTWEDWPDGARRVFEAMRSPAGEEIVLTKNVFIERILPSSVLRPLTPEEMEAYRAPFAEGGETRRPMLTWPREIPIEGQPADVHAVVESYAADLAQSEVPKLFVNADPGSILTGRPRQYCRTWKNQEEVTVTGAHFIQEDSPNEIGQAIRAFLQRHPA